MNKVYFFAYFKWGRLDLNMQYCVELSTMPSLFSLYRKIFFGRKPGWDQGLLPQIHVTCPNVTLSAEKVAQYAKVCRYEFDGKLLPVTYLHVLAFRLQAEIFTHAKVTFPLLGMIHLRNQIVCHRVLSIDDIYDFECDLLSSRVTDVGLEFDLVSKVHVAGELVWESVSTYLYRVDRPGRRARPPKTNGMEWQNPINWHLNEDLGRRYAKASGDFNLIHLHPLLSKRFGFDRVLVHGMWSKARCVAELASSIGSRPCRIDVTFKLPLFMPADVSFSAAEAETGFVFELRDIRGRRPYLSGELSFISES